MPGPQFGPGVFHLWNRSVAGSVSEAGQIGAAQEIMRIQMWVGKRVRRLLGIRADSGSHRSTITLGDRNRQWQVILDPGLPDDAYQQLFHLDLSLVPPGVLTWDSRSGGWRNA